MPDRLGFDVRIKVVPRPLAKLLFFVGVELTEEFIIHRGFLLFTGGMPARPSPLNCC
jgi:hypothetical protein